MKLKTYEQLFEKSKGKYKHVIISKIFNDFLEYNQDISIQIFKGVLLSVETDVSFIEIDDIDTITYLPFDKYSLISPDWHEDMPTINPFISKYRQKMKIGKFIKKMYHDNNVNITNQNKQIDNVVEIYKNFMDCLLNDKKIKKVTGEDIRYWYLEDNYSKGKEH